MTTYAVYEFFTTDEIERSWLISILSDYHFDGFEETDETLKAFAVSDKIKAPEIKEVLANAEMGHIHFTVAELENKNWNEEWEKNFEPVVIAGRVGIRAPFHNPLNTEYEIIIEPKMSFGTGHHATTASVIEIMLQEKMAQRSVLDFGSGTGILSILAEKLNAAKIIALDHEEWAYRNCLENIERNGCVHIQAIQGDETTNVPELLSNFSPSQSDVMTGELKVPAQKSVTVPIAPSPSERGSRGEVLEKFDLILANVNRHVILANISRWKGWLQNDGVLVVSGILTSDEQEVLSQANKHQLNVRNIVQNNGWLAISFHHI